MAIFRRGYFLESDFSGILGKIDIHLQLVKKHNIPAFIFPAILKASKNTLICHLQAVIKHRLTRLEVLFKAALKSPYIDSYSFFTHKITQIEIKAYTEGILRGSDRALIEQKPYICTLNQVP